VIVMVGAHVTDAWTSPAGKATTLYKYVIFVAGLAAPLFLFLAGLTLAMAASARAEKVGHRAAAAVAARRGLQVFALAFLFRLQSQLLGWGAWLNFLKVDILNVMGIALVAAALLWRSSTHRGRRIFVFAVATAIVAMSTPLVREAGMLAALPDPVEAYLRPLPGRTNFALFPWAAFVLCGAIAGELVAAARTAAQQRRLQAGLLLSGAAGMAVAYWASFRPSIYQVAHFWTSSPTFFFLRAGMCTAMLPIAKAVDAFHAWLRRQRTFSAPDVPGRVVTTLGRSSLFVYWIHVEMAYGGLARPLKGRLPLELSLLAAVLLVAVLYRITQWKDRKMTGVELTGAWRIFAPVVK
jgi:uncharacterized membrane protein